MDDGLGEAKLTFVDTMSRANKPTHQFNHSLNVIKKFVLNRNISINMNREGATIILYEFDDIGRATPLPPEVYRDRPRNGEGDLVTFCARVLQLCESWHADTTVHLVDPAFWDH